MHLTPLTLAAALLGVLAGLYGVAVMLIGSGTKFHLVWFAIAAALLGLAALLATGRWGSLPAVVRGGLCTIAGLLTAVILVSVCVVSTGMRATPEADLDYLVVLGAQVRRDGPSVVLRYRLDAALAYLERNPRTKVVVSGGQGPNEPWSEARGMADYLERKGIERARIIEEGRSTTTRENLSFSLALMQSDGGSAASRVGVVTNDFHVYRAVRTARKLGFSHVCGVAGYSTPAYYPNNLLREALGLLKDTVVGNA